MWGWRRLGYVVLGLGARLADRRANGVRIETTTDEEHADPLEGLPIARQRPAAEVASKGVGRAFCLVRRHRLILRTALRCAMLGPVRLDDVARHAVLAELGLDHAHAARGVAVALLAPPAGKGGVINVPELAEALEDLVDDRLGCPGPAQAPRGLPLRPRARPEVAHRDLHRRGRVGGRGIRLPAARAEISH